MVEERRSQVCLGLDPDPARLGVGGRGRDRAGDEFLSHSERNASNGGEDPAQRAAAAVTAWAEELIARAGGACVAAKLQLACFERLGAPGWSALHEVAAAARGAGLLVIADGKRGDVPVSAAAYGQALVGETETPWGPVAGLGADAFTASPLLGGDALEPLLEAAAGAGAGVFALVRTSNPGAREVLDLPTPEGPVHERIARLVAERAERLEGGRGLSGMGAVVGATEPRFLARLRELMPKAIFLLPGVGAQGGRIGDLGAALADHPASMLVAASRSIAAAADPGAAAAELREQAWSLAARG